MSMKKIVAIITFVVVSVISFAQQKFDDGIYPTNVTPRKVSLFGYHNKQRLSIGTVDIVLRIKRTPISGTPYEIQFLEKYTEDELSYKHTFYKYNVENIEQSLNANLVKSVIGRWKLDGDKYIEKREIGPCYNRYYYYIMTTDSLQALYRQETQQSINEAKAVIARMEEERNANIENDFPF